MKNMKKMLLEKEMRASFWEQYREVPKIEMIEKEIEENEHMKIGDMFMWQKNDNGDFLVMENRPITA